MWMMVDYFPSTVHIENKFMVNGCASNVALLITHPCIAKLIIFINVPSYIQGGQKVVRFNHPVCILHKNNVLDSFVLLNIW